MNGEATYTTRSIDDPTARRIYDVLVEECGAWVGDDAVSCFVHAQVNGCDEYRFMGKLGFGGKFYNDQIRWRVSCYREDMTPARRKMIDRANARLAEIRAAWVAGG